MEVNETNSFLWAQALDNVDKIKDALDHPVDEGIRETVAILMLYKFHTSQSCEGHHDISHGLSYPWVEIYAPEPEKWRGSKGSMREELEKAWIIENLNQRNRMLKLLEEFYKNRQVDNYSTNIVYSNIGAFGGFRIQSLGAESIDILNEDERNILINQYKKEMHDFTEFLKYKFLNS